MAPGRLLTRPLLVFLVLVAAVLLRAGHERLGSVPPSVAIQRLADGDLEGSERRELLRGLLAAGDLGGDPAARRTAVLAAIALDDAATYARLAGEGPPFGAEDFAPDALPPLHGLGDPVVAALLAAMGDEAAERAAAARRRYRQVAAQSRLAGMQLAGRLAQAGLARLP